MAVYATGDTHGDVFRIIYGTFPGEHIVGEGDVLFILGDFGVVFDNTATPLEKRILELLAQMPFIIMVVDGNHENHPRLYGLPETTMFGGKVGILKEGKVFVCRRGEIYTIDGKKFFTFGGATSIDRSLRVPGLSWWKEEVPSAAEMDRGLQNLEDNNYIVDYILAHTAPENIAKILIEKSGVFFYDPDPTRKYLEHVCSVTTFEHFYCGHWHVERDIDNYHILWESIRQII